MTSGDSNRRSMDEFIETFDDWKQQKKTKKKTNKNETKDTGATVTVVVAITSAPVRSALIGGWTGPTAMGDPFVRGRAECLPLTSSLSGAGVARDVVERRPPSPASRRDAPLVRKSTKKNKQNKKKKTTKNPQTNKPARKTISEDARSSPTRLPVRTDQLEADWLPSWGASGLIFSFLPTTESNQKRLG